MTEQKRKIKEVHDVFAGSGYSVTHSATPERHECMLPMEDGVLLRTIVVKPEGEGPFHAVLMRSCYPDEEGFYLAVAEEYAARGFAWVIQFCRGTGDSQGVWEPNVNERADGRATACWLDAQTWTANLGYWGVSYLALTGWLIADILPPKFRTMYLTMYGTFRYVSAYQDGLFRHDVLTSWAMRNAGFPVTADYLDSCRYRPHLEVDEALWGRRVEWYRQWVSSTDAHDPYWNEGVWQLLKEIPSRVKVPVSISEGWYDHHLGSGIETYRALSDECRAQSEFLIGPWNHWFEAPLQDDAGSHYERGDTLRAFAWFRRLLAREEAPVGRVVRYIPRADCWIESKRFDLTREDAAYWLSSGGKLVSDREQIVACERSYLYDPDNPILTHGGEALLESRSEIGSLLQPEPDYRPDVLSWMSEPLKEDITICGAVRVRLWVRSDAEDTAFAARLMEVGADGKTYHVRGGITTLACRGHYAPGEAAEAEIKMWDVAWQFRAGYRIRLDIQSSDFPQYCQHTNIAGIWSEQTFCQPANQTVLCSPEKPSRILLPLLERDDTLNASLSDTNLS